MKIDIQLDQTKSLDNGLDSAVFGLSTMFRAANSAPAVRDFGNTFLAASVARFITQTGNLNELSQLMQKQFTVGAEDFVQLLNANFESNGSYLKLKFDCEILRQDLPHGSRIMLCPQESCTLSLMEGTELIAQESWQTAGYIF